MAAFFLQGLRLALVAKMCSQRPQAINKAEIGQAFLQETLFSPFLFLDEAAVGIPTHA